jgi:hypothetical protein
MTAAQGSFTQIRNGILEHFQRGDLGPFDAGVYLLLHLRADWATGIYNGCALGIACSFGDPKLKEHVQKSLRRLKDRQYINYKKGDGSRHCYPMLLNKYEPTVGELCGTRLNAWKHGDLVIPEYEPKNGGRTVTERKRNGSRTVVAPILDLDLKTSDFKDQKPSSPDGEVDPRHAPLRKLIQTLYLEKFEVACPWNASEGKALKTLLRDNPQWTSEQLSRMVRNRFASEGVNGDRPRMWIPNLAKYSLAPLTTFQRPKPSSGANGFGISKPVLAVDQLHKSLREGAHN